MPLPSLPVLPSPAIGISLGDPSGIGPEIVARALCELPLERRCRVRIYGNAFVLHRAFHLIDAPPPPSMRIDDVGVLTDADVVYGRPNPATGHAQVAYLEAAVDAAQRGEIAGLATAPISKSSAQNAGFLFPGHTEFLANRLQAESVAMMFVGPKLKVALATVHEAIAEVPHVLTTSRIHSAILLVAQALQNDFAVRRPRIGVLGLNPHSGEGGRFGDEETRTIVPAIKAAQLTLGDTAQLVGPLVPDAAFRMPFDCFVAMYHDQGLIPVKLIDFDQSVNLTLGLPIVRTSPDHGVAYDIAGRGVARSTSMSAAIDLAFRLVDHRANSATPPRKS